MGRPDTPVLLVTKLHPPPVPRQSVVRTRALERLSEPRPLTVVSSPAGFGKTTVLAEWRERSALPVAWVSLDEGDDDAVVLWSHVVAALGRVCPAVAAAVPADSVAAAPLLEVVLPRLINALADARPVALVLDDFHRLSNVETVAWFVDRLPAGVRVLVASRTDPPLPLGSLRARGRLSEVGFEELRFDDGEADEFLNSLLGLELSDEDVALLTQRTEGWPAGLYLAALSLAGRADKQARLVAFGGTTATVVDYLSAEVLAGAEHLEIMLRTSVLERLCAPLCDALLGRDDSERVLRELARSNLFLLELDDERRWYRFHHLFAELLRDELARRESPAPLHVRAAEWHRAFGTADEAIHHALAGRAFEVAETLIAETWVHYVNAGRTASVLDWLNRLPGERLDAHLLLVAAWTHALRGDEGRMRAALARAEPVMEASGPLPDGFASLDSSLSVLRAAFAWGDVGASLEHGRRSAELEGVGAPWRPVITWALGWAHYCRDELDEAARWFEETVRSAPAADQWVVGVGAMADLSLIAGASGDVDSQWRLARQAYALAGEHGLLDAREDGEVHTAYGVALAAVGRRDEARAALERGVFLRRLWEQPLDLIDGLLALAAFVDDRAEAVALLDEVERLVVGCRDPGALGARLAALRGALDAVELTARERTVLALLATDLSEREIGVQLYLSFNTVHTHVRSIYRKLGVTTRAEAVARSKIT